MKALKDKDPREKSVPEVEELIAQEREGLYRARRDLVFRRLTDTAQLKIRRNNIARLLTLIQEKKGGQA